jgi:glycine betaine/proline transport system permease protein
MFSLPIGEYFETFVNWLIDSFQGFFDAISDVLDFSITILERTFLLDAQVLYAPILFGLLFALVTGLLAQRLLSRRAFIPVAAATAVVFGGLEIWRVNALNQTVDPETAQTYAADYSELADSLKKMAPDDFSDAGAALEAVSTSLGNVDPESEGLSSLERSLTRAQRNLSRIRSTDYERVFSTLEGVEESLEESGIPVDEAARSQLVDAQLQFQTLSLIEEAERLVLDFEDEAAEDDPDRMNAFLNQRTYDTVEDLLGVSLRYFDANSGQLYEQAREQALTARAHLRTLNPERLTWYAPIVTILLLSMIAYLIAGSGIVIFTVIGFLLIIGMDLWIPTVESLALVLSATFFALLIGIPVGIAAARSETVHNITRPILDFMQTMPAFVYLIPAVIFFGLGKVPGAMATLIFAMPPAVRLTSLGIRQVPEEVVEAGQAFGATPRQLLFKAQLPIAMITILAGVNQTIMLALSMVVIGGMIGAGGLGEVVLSGITQLKLGLGFEGGIAVVILAIYLDRVTQALGSPKSETNT